MSVNITIAGNTAVVAISGYYELVDMAEIMELYHNGRASELTYIIFNCQDWEAFNVFGNELLMLHNESKNRENNPLFCGVSDGLRSVLLLMHPPEFPAPLFLADVEECLRYIWDTYPIPPVV
ncbi:hypothetical protein Q5H93_15255 [Hymenobacter sp. ASUV-10]|uniref:STAS/SEC14 domain-containing protein n=1 Tax=Hymenobacter aranciens TaxID=3063996 RepID=A0ABT9BE98_9BACT|nr:hypothetical protein [Hymenobacter sp. ASUV-10]MDO7876100.1 hypothetical protein [Hymenobacter sp. ASUV-10]